MPLTLLDYAVDDGKSKTRALAEALCREERLEEVIHCTGLHSMASIAHGELDVIPYWEFRRHRFYQRHVLNGNGDPSAFRHGISCIECKVHNHLMDLSNVCPHTTCLLAQDDREGNILAKN